MRLRTRHVESAYNTFHIHGRTPGLGFAGGRKIVTSKFSDQNFATTFFIKKSIIFPPSKNSDDLLFSHFIIWDVGLLCLNALRKPHNVGLSVHNVFPNIIGERIHGRPSPQTLGDRPPVSPKSPPVHIFNHSLFILSHLGFLVLVANLGSLLQGLGISENEELVIVAFREITYRSMKTETRPMNSRR